MLGWGMLFFAHASACKRPVCLTLPQRPPVLDCFRDVCLSDCYRTRQIGNRARHAQDALGGAGGKVQAVDGAFQQGLVAG